MDYEIIDVFVAILVGLGFLHFLESGCFERRAQLLSLIIPNRWQLLIFEANVNCLRLANLFNLFFNLFLMNKITFDLSFNKLVFINLPICRCEAAHEFLEIGKSPLQLLIKFMR